MSLFTYMKKLLYNNGESFKLCIIVCTKENRKTFTYKSIELFSQACYNTYYQNEKIKCSLRSAIRRLFYSLF